MLIRQVHTKRFICHYWCFLDKRVRFQPAAWNGCHDVLMMSIDFNSITILNIHDFDYRCIIDVITKSEAMNLLRDAD